MKVRFGRAVAALLLTLSCASFAADGPMSDVVRVRGRVATPIDYTVDGLTRLELHEVALRGDGDTLRTYRGVLLRDLVAASRPLETDRFDLRRSVVVAQATDGYLAVFSWAELFNGPLGDRVLVAVQRDGAPLGVDEGRIALVAGGDLRPGPRHVRWLTSIEMRRLDP